MEQRRQRSRVSEPAAPRQGPWNAPHSRRAKQACSQLLSRSLGRGRPGRPGRPSPPSWPAGLLCVRPGQGAGDAGWAGGAARPALRLGAANETWGWCWRCCEGSCRQGWRMAGGRPWRTPRRLRCLAWPRQLPQQHSARPCARVAAGAAGRLPPPGQQSVWPQTAVQGGECPLRR